ncbi:hypothetical protein BK816_05435 [Boudabousia tangfeifanii]|uniref:DAGKc domain-containing protein n=1 Tax=Boudabousia tangfeifanii TaxID=1912795 RepID=A0A1D9MKJ4_9ACTO|nr:YegS/Rv2252/BmrU family lipid kinase [Boudabousia tangfeifanii]AOZ72806.1 hypothetical protein BK816_05435 [Boudabousia tangfeifanii]
MRLLFILNPTANGGRAAQLANKIRSFYLEHADDPRLGSTSPSLEIRLTEYPSHATRLAEENAKLFDVIVAVGGDGTINEVCRGLIAAKTGQLGVIPAGTGNDTATGLELPKTLAEALWAIHESPIRHLDYGTVNGQVFINSATVGFDALVASHGNRIKRVLKSHWAYVIGLFTALATYHFPKIQVPQDFPAGDDWAGTQRDLCLLAVCNGRYYGGGIEIVPGATLDDELLDLCLITNISKPRLLKLLPTILKGTHIKQKQYLRTWKTQQFSLPVLTPTLLGIDGEISEVAVGEVLHFELHPGGINFVG